MPEDLVVFQIISTDSKCEECGEPLPKGHMLRKEKERGLCLDCADLSHLAFLGAGDACLTRRARKYSPIVAVVLRWSRSRKRYERQGLLVTSDAIDRAEDECLEDADLRERRRFADAQRRSRLDADFVLRFAAKIRGRYPQAPEGEETAIAEHACLKSSGRVGRSAAAKELDTSAIDHAVRAHVRHAHTNYDSLLFAGCDRDFARGSIRRDVDRILESWSTK